ncbi:MAG TPA: 2TM domain-containing protein [Allocoleopsis sp.]
MENHERYRRAKRRVAQLKAFYIHFLIYVGVMLLLIIIDILDGDNWWFYWPLLGWGIGVAAHAVSVFGIASLFDSRWEEKTLRELMNQKHKDW